MIRNCNSDSPTNLWNNYHHFEIEKYLNQMSQNPYIEELEHELVKKKKTKLVKYIRKDIYDSLSISDINNIWEKCKNEIGLNELSNQIKEKISNDISIVDKMSIFNDIIKDENLLNIKKDEIILEPTKLRISTMTACCKVGKDITIDTKYLYKMFQIQKDIVSDEVPRGKKKRIYKHNLKQLVIGCKAEDYPVKGYFEKDKKSNFFNSAALNLLIYDNKCINIKVFNNGKIQMTGVPDEENGRLAVNIVIDLLKSIPDDNETGDKVVFNKKHLKLIDYRTVLINSDYFCGIEIQRENLSNILQDKYDLSVNYESENYPGVKLEYFWNKINIDLGKEGQCLCQKKCLGKGTGDGNGDCKKVTISTFQSGKVIVTGARSIEQINSAYIFINKIFQNNYEYVRKKTKSNKDKINSNSDSKFIFIKKINVTNYNLYKLLI